MVNAECSASSSYILGTRDGACCCRRPYSRSGQESVQFINAVLKERVLPKQFEGGAGGGRRAE